MSYLPQHSQRDINPAIANMVSDWLQLLAASISCRRVSGSVEILPLLLVSGSTSQNQFYDILENSKKNVIELLDTSDRDERATRQNVLECFQSFSKFPALLKSTPIKRVGHLATGWML